MPIQKQHSNGGIRHCVEQHLLPAPERRACNERRIESADLPMGLYDEDAHADLFTAPITMQKEARRKAEIAELLLRLQSTANWAERASIVREAFGEKVTSQPSLKSILSTIKRVDPINFAPALLANYKGRTCKAELSTDAWRFFMTTIRNAAPDWPLVEAWRRARDAGKELNWAVPSYVTFYRRWIDLTEAQRFEARLGADQASKQIRMHAHRDKTSIGSLEWVSLDGRTKDFFVDWGDGKAVRSTFIALVDVASNVILDWELAPSENAAVTVRLIKRVCAKYGIFDRLYPDNGPAFSGNAVAGGSDYRFRFKTDSQKDNTMGICNHGYKVEICAGKKCASQDCRACLCHDLTINRRWARV